LEVGVAGVSVVLVTEEGTARFANWPDPGSIQDQP